MNRGFRDRRFSFTLRSLMALQALPPGASCTPTVEFVFEKNRMPPDARTVQELLVVDEI